MRYHRDGSYLGPLELSRPTECLKLPGLCWMYDESNVLQAPPRLSSYSIPWYLLVGTMEHGSLLWPRLRLLHSHKQTNATEGLHHMCRLLDCVWEQSHIDSFSPGAKIQLNDPSGHFDRGRWRRSGPTEPRPSPSLTVKHAGLS